jgi:hypothetical protein
MKFVGQKIMIKYFPYISNHYKLPSDPIQKAHNLACSVLLLVESSNDGPSVKVQIQTRLRPGRTGETIMDAAVKNYEVEMEHVAAESSVPLTEATFTEIYELISHNRSLVKSELAVLQELIQKKLMQTAKESPAQPSVICEKVNERRLRH